MTRPLLLLLLLATGATLTHTLPAPVVDGNSQVPVQPAGAKRYIIGLNDGVDTKAYVANFEAKIASLKAQDDSVGVYKTFSIIPAFAAALDDATVQALKQDAQVKYVEVDGIVTAMGSK